MLAFAGGTFGGIPAIGAAYQGGFFAGQISTAGNGVADYNLVVGPLSTAQSQLAWKNATSATAGADSVINGPQNTADMVADGNSTVYPCAHFCNNLVIGGFSDWYMPAKNEQEVCYYNLKPGTTNNNTASGANANAVPARAGSYTAGTPSQTSAAAFQTSGGQDYVGDSYWSSTESTAANAEYQKFSTGIQLAFTKTYANRVRAVRRVAV
jgi:hypothetical protein